MLQTLKNFKVLEVNDGYCLGVRGYNLYKYDLYQGYFSLLAKVPDFKYAFLSRFEITKRFFRAEINNLYTLPNGDMLLIAKKGIFKCSQGEASFRKVFSILRGSKTLNLCITPNGNIFFGEYFANMQKTSVHIYASEDLGESWNVVYTFPEGNINHVHGIFWDEFEHKIWVATGDRENECTIGYTKDEFKTFVEVFRGGQEYRTTNLFFYKDHLIYATDSQYMKNSIKRINRSDHTISELQEIQGTAIKGGQYGSFSFISTTVEPSEVNLDKYSHVWISRDGLTWKEIYKDKKDCLPAIFQFGSMEFPIYKIPIKNRFLFSGRSLKKTGGNTVIMDL